MDKINWSWWRKEKRRQHEIEEKGRSGQSYGSLFYGITGKGNSTMYPCFLFIYMIAWSWI